MEIGDLEERPVKVCVEGQVYEVWPISEHQNNRNIAIDHDLKSSIADTRISKSKYIKNIHRERINIRSPLPGTILSVKINPGDHTHIGQELCVIEAMKMKNVIRANRKGIIKKVCITLGQHVRQDDLLSRI